MSFPPSVACNHLRPSSALPLGNLRTTLLEAGIPHHPFVASALLGSAIAVSGTALADTTTKETTLDAVTVIGTHEAAPYQTIQAANPKFTAPLLDTPRTIKVITQQEMEERGATSVEDVLRTTPGITLGSGEGGTPVGLRPYIRGFEAAFSMAVDGVRTRGRTTYESFNLDNIEVSFGSDGVIAGAGSAAGSISLNTKEPKLGENFHNVSVTVGNASQKRTTYDGNISFTDDVSGRLNLLWQDSGVPGSRYVEDNKKGIAPSLAVRINRDHKLTLKAQHVNSTGTPGGRIPFANAAYNGGKNIAGWANFGSGTPDDPYLPLENIDRNNFYGVLGRDFKDSNNSSVNLKHEYQLSPTFTLSSTLSWIETDTKMAVMRPSVSVSGGQFVVNRNGNGGYRASNRKTDTATFSTHAAGKVQLAGFEHSLAFGIEIARDRVNSGSSPVNATTPNSTPLFQPNPYAPFTSTGAFGPMGIPATTKSKAIYVFDTIKLNEHWMLNGGLRIEDYKLDDGTSSWGDTLADYQLGIMYKPAANTTLYASVNTTSTPPGACANQGGSNCPADSFDEYTVSTKAEKTRNTELGVKWDLMDGDLSVTASLYNTEKNNARIADEDGNYTLNAGNQRGRGYDLSVAGRLTKAWSITAGYTYLDAEQRDRSSKNRPINSAKNTFSMWTTYAINNHLTIGGGANYVGLKYVNPANTAAVPSYWRYDAMVSYRINKQALLQLNITNLTDQTYYDSSHVGSFATLQPGRSITAKLNYSF